MLAETVTGFVGQILDEGEFDEHTHELLQELYSTAQREIETEETPSMESLVGRRFNSLEELGHSIAKIRGKKVVKIFESESDRPEGMDFMLDYEDEDMLDVYTIFYLKDNANQYYITEV